MLILYNMYVIDIPSAEAVCYLAGAAEAAVGSSPFQLSAPTPPPCEAPPSAP